jgi:hypothetical protein
MKNLVWVAILVLIAACSKQKSDYQSPAPVTNSSTTQRCDFGIKDFNLNKRAPMYDGIMPDADRGGKGGTNTGTAVILLDFDGQTVSNTSWNFNGPIVCAPANLSASDIANIVQRVGIDYSPFNITVTTSETVYNAAPATKRMRVIVTETWEWFGQAGGTSFVGSFTWGDNTPCFVFSSLLNYNTKNIAEASSHEAGHTLGLYHQSLYDADCNKVSEYNSGVGSGEIGWAPIMGVGYYKNLTIWHKGPNAYGCSSMQDDISLIAAITGLKSDDFGNTTQTAATISNSVAGMINNNTDIDMFKVTLTDNRTVTLSPVSTGTNNESGDLDMILKVYNSQGNLVSTIDNTTCLSASTVLAPGTYYLSAGTVSNVNISNYSMVGNYTLSIN